MDSELAGVTRVQIDRLYLVRYRIDAEEVTAVSYTHLRAHETVLDIVCRLLLEKQKTYTNNDSKYVTIQ